MGETHIAHAVATFSELGIATGLVWLGDVVKFRSNLVSDLVIAEESLRVTTEDFHAKAEGFNGTIRLGIRTWMAARKYIYLVIIYFLLALLQCLPYICIGSGIYALFGISFYPSIPSFMPDILSCFSYTRETLDQIYFWMSFFSFMATCIPLVPMITKGVINRYVLKEITIV